MLPRFLASPGISVLINAFAVLFLSVNLVQNYFMFHNHAIGQSSLPYATMSDMPQPSSHDPLTAISLSIPRSPAKALPSILISEEEESKIKRDQYGGKGDKPHLGGFTEFDPLGVSPSLWKHMISHYGIKSLLDVGCGKGVSTSWFVTHGLEYVQCVEGSHDAVSQSIVPSTTPEENYQRVVEHDFSRGPWWPERTVDAVWCVEFTEHVGRNYQPNYLTAFRKAALIFVTHSNWGGWHHVEVHDDDWWRTRWEAAGLVYSESLTQEARLVAIQDQNRRDLTLDMTNDKLYFVGQHVYLNVQVFINPMVASLPEHSHLFAEVSVTLGVSSGLYEGAGIACSD
ncbi:predicted protein [Thalassiosira pseudonana CCMP1335]|uniref:Uncharacterized protein n=1 Tax=Thalassiosira pseudonana TaxID=35128 RepID=B8CE17_THAPS|nr:predicted protein [Thalassiosira pseudonana CCMP1335]EED88192.1 predicted protein [Thalassiosira pseudonana CCMP1335]